MILLLLACTGGPPSSPASPATETTGHTGDPPLPAWSCNGATSLPRIYTGGPDVRFVGPNPAGAFGSAYTLGDLDGSGSPDLFVSEPLPYDEIQGDFCLYSPGDGGGYWISDPLAGGVLADVAVRFPGQITGCPDVLGDTELYGATISITADDYTGDGQPELVLVGPEGSRFFSGTPSGTLQKVDADLFLPGVFVGGPELDIDQDGDLEFAGLNTVHLDGQVPTVDTILEDVGYFGGFVDFDADGVPEIFGPTANAAVVHVEAPITLDRVQAAEQLPTANPTYLDGTIRGVRGLARDWWIYVEVDSDSEFADDPCFDRRHSSLVQGGDLDEPGIAERRSFLLRYQQNLPVASFKGAGDFNGDGEMDFLLEDRLELLILLGPVEPGQISLDHTIRIPAHPNFMFLTNMPDTIYDIDGDGLDDIIAQYSPGSVGGNGEPPELHIYLASSFLNGPFDYPNEP